MNPYQKIIKDGELIQAGQMDTPEKFKQLTDGVDLAGKTVIDVGCNLGMMCNLVRQHGGIPKGIDIHNQTIEEAKIVFPDIEFRCQRGEELSGSYDIVIASAMLHYIKDLDKIFLQFSRCAKQVLCDVWLHESQAPIFALTHRDIFIPSRPAFLHIVSKYFSTIEERGIALTPDGSSRYLFRISDPVPNKPKAVLIDGDGDTGKTTLAKTYFDWPCLGLDHVTGGFGEQIWGNFLSIAWLAHTIRGSNKQGYLDHYERFLAEWIREHKNRDIVIEGYDLMFPDVKEIVLRLLEKWDVQEIHLTENRRKK